MSREMGLDFWEMDMGGVRRGLKKRLIDLIHEVCTDDVAEITSAKKNIALELDPSAVFWWSIYKGPFG